MSSLIYIFFSIKVKHLQDFHPMNRHLTILLQRFEVLEHIQYLLLIFFQCFNETMSPIIQISYHEGDMRATSYNYFAQVCTDNTIQHLYCVLGLFACFHTDIVCLLISCAVILFAFLYQNHLAGVCKESTPQLINAVHDKPKPLFSQWHFT